MASSIRERNKQHNKDLIYSALRQYVEEHHYSPTTRELMALTGFRSTSSINAYLSMMRAEGTIDYEPTKPRTLRILI